MHTPRLFCVILLATHVAASAFSTPDLAHALEQRNVVNQNTAKAKLNIHIVPHTHDDVGWLKTVDEYYSGANNSIQHAGVRNILNAIQNGLAKDPKRTFTYVEQAFFQRWWREQDSASRELTRKQVANGQLVFVNGGWCMHDEAATHYVGMIDQTTVGHRNLLAEFGPNGGIPTVAWQLDPFGHSATQAALLSAEAGMDALFFGRIDYQDLKIRLEEQRGEFIWRASKSLGADAQVFAGLTGSFSGNYGPPHGFDFDAVVSNDEPIEINEKLESFNGPKRLAEFAKLVDEQASRTRGAHIMLTMGSDFQYEAAEEWFTNLDHLIALANSDPKQRYNAFYSDPANYTRAKREEAKSGAVTWPVTKDDDFFPYADGPHQFWSGYFTSRPALKRFIRSTSGLFTAARMLQALAVAQAKKAGTMMMTTMSASSSPLEELALLEEAIGVAQHHDAATGTSKQHVAFDYAKRLAAGRAAGDAVIAKSLDAIGGAAATGGGNWSFCARLNESVCEMTQAMTGKENLTVTVWNSLAQPREVPMSFPISAALAASGVVVVTSKGAQIPVQLVDERSGAGEGESVNNYQRKTGEGGDFTLFFIASLPALGFQQYVFQSSAPDAAAAAVVAAARSTTTYNHDQIAAGSAITIENEFNRLTFVNGVLATWEKKGDGANSSTTTSFDVTQKFCSYKSSEGDAHSTQRSGAYIFRPQGENGAKEIAVCTPILNGLLNDKPVEIYAVIQGESNQIVAQVRQRFSSWLTQTVTLYKGGQEAVFEFTIGEVPFTELGTGHEIVSRFTTAIASNGILLTDSNGREMMTRKRDFRSKWALNQTERVAGNYYPCGAAAAIYDDDAQLTVLVDAAQAVGSIHDGELELMVHRRISKDDGRGVGEPLDELQFVTDYASQPEHGKHFGPGLVIRGRHSVVLSSLKSAGSASGTWRPIADALFSPPLVALRSGGGGGLDAAFTALTAPLPINVQIMTLQALSPSKLLLRLAHQFGIGEDEKFSRPVTIDLATLFDPTTSDVEIANAREVSLTNNQNKSAILKRREDAMGWSSGSNDEEKPHPWRSAVFTWNNMRGAPSPVVLGPLEIKTFVLDLATKE